MGLVQREIEAAGISTLALSNIADLTASVSVPRLAAIEHPFGQNVGRPGDSEGQRAVLRAALTALEKIDTPGGRVDLPFSWDGDDHSHPPQPPPITAHLVKHPFQVTKLIRRQIPET